LFDNIFTTFRCVIYLMFPVRKICLLRDTAFAANISLRVCNSPSLEVGFFPGDIYLSRDYIFQLTARAHTHTHTHIAQYVSQFVLMSLLSISILSYPSSKCHEVSQLT
jgi:hypothetical protein